MTGRKKTQDTGSDSSSRSEATHEHEDTVRKGYEAAREPERQGDGDPGPEQVSEQTSQRE